MRHIIDQDGRDDTFALINFFYFVGSPGMHIYIDKLEVDAIVSKETFRPTTIWTPIGTK